jgi:hypothetical protein
MREKLKNRRLIFTFSIFVMIFLIGVIGNNNVMPLNRLVKQAYISVKGPVWSPPLIVISTPDIGNSFVGSIAFVEYVFKYRSHGDIYTSVYELLGLLDPIYPILINRILPDMLQVVDTKGNSLCELGKTYDYCQAWISENCKRVVWISDENIYTRIIPNGRVSKLVSKKYPGTFWSWHTSCKISSDGSAAVIVNWLSADSTGYSKINMQWFDFKTGSSINIQPIIAPTFLEKFSLNKDEDWIDVVCDISPDGRTLLVAGSETPSPYSSLYQIDGAFGTIKQLTSPTNASAYCPAYAPGTDGYCFIRMPDLSIAQPLALREVSSDINVTECSIIYKGFDDINKNETFLASCNSFSSKIDSSICFFPSIITAYQKDREKTYIVIFDKSKYSVKNKYGKSEYNVEQEPISLLLTDKKDFRIGFLNTNPVSFIDETKLPRDVSELWFSGYVGMLDDYMLMFGGRSPSPSPWQLDSVFTPNDCIPLGWIDKNCKVVGWSGKHGGNRSIRCSR